MKRSGRWFAAIIFTAVAGESIASGVKVEELDFLPTGAYFQRTQEAIDSARESVWVVMYAIAGPEKAGSQTAALIESLIRAHRRGVEVKLLLDYSLEKALQDWNEAAARRLAAAGIAVRFDHPKHVTHTKLVVIDGRVSILGSANWSWSAFSHNWESSVLIVSVEVARRFREYAAALFAKGKPLEEWKRGRR
jgi:phosphatidylserine/phosphatidylglycerophosphate/cardiolipin synthase-like enzyme